MKNAGMQFGTIGRLLLVLAVVVATWLIVWPQFQEADAQYASSLSQFDDTDGDGKEDFFDDCPCTTGETQRDIDGKTWCVAAQDPEAFTELQDALDKTAELNRDGFRQQDGTMYYTKNACAWAVQNNLWP